MLLLRAIWDNPLGSFLRSRRERTDPRTHGVAVGARRRTPGLRRSDVAARAGISVEWYTRLEQGRGGQPSVQVLEAIASALDLTPAEREHIFLLARGHPRENFGAVDPQRQARLERLVAGFPYGPAYIKNASWDVVAWNEAARVLLTDYPALAPSERNVLRTLFTDPASRTRIENWRQEASLAVATFRRELTRWGDAKEQASTLIEELYETSPDFAVIWDSHDVGTLGQGIKRLNHEQIGQVSMWYESCAVDESPGLGLVLYTPVAQSDADKIRSLLAHEPSP